MSAMPEAALWTTDDMWLASFIVLNMKPEDVYWQGNFCYFSFEDCPLLRELILQYQMGHASVDPRNYSNAFAKLKKAMKYLRRYPHKDFDQLGW